jgi:hypothetical protein
MAMEKHQRWIQWLGIVGLGLTLGGCPQSDWQAVADTAVMPTPTPTATTAVTDQSGTAKDGAVQTAATVKPTPPSEPQVLPYEICSEVSGWQRPTPTQQQQVLASNPRYQGGLDTPPLQGMADRFWEESVIAFTTYGLSARTEPVNLSGLWTIADDMWTCYEGDRPEAINQGEWAELWVIGHRVVSLAWADGQYLLTVVPTGSGVQFVQFPRQEQGESLPLMVTTAEGHTLSAVSGDW